MRPRAAVAAVALLAVALGCIVAPVLSAAGDSARPPRSRGTASLRSDSKGVGGDVAAAPGSGPAAEGLAPPWRPDRSCPGGKAKSILDCPEMVCPCGRGMRVVLARAYDHESRCCNRPSCDGICRNHCPRFPCPCGVPGDLAAATDDATGECIADQQKVCAQACAR